MITITIAAFVIFLVLGVPVAFAVGMAGFLGLWWSGAYPLAIIIQQIFLTADSFVLLAIPLFVLAGALMETGGIAVRLVRFAQALVGWIRGGLAMAVVVAEYIFSGISGSTIADVSAIGATMIPPLTKAGYKPEEAVSVVAAASAMGILVPPCILMIIIGAIANVSVAALFAGGFVPALVLALAIMGYIYVRARRDKMAASQTPSLSELGRASIDALIPMGLPIIIFGGILGGIFTPTEAAAVAVLYAAIVGLFIYGEISWSALPGILLHSAVLTANVCFLLGTAAVVAWILAVAQVPAYLAELLRSLSADPKVFLLFSAVLFIILGAVIESSFCPLFCPW
jgi:C4-dicarboxylate transporter DctM subunit